MMRILRFALGALLILSIAFVAVTSWLVATQQGTRVLTAQLVTYVPGLSIEGLGGTFVDGVEIPRLEYRSKIVSVTVQNATLRLELWPLLNLQAVRLLDVDVEALVVSTSPTEETTGEPLTMPPLPVELQVRAADFTRIEIDGLQLTGVSFAGVWNARRLRLRKLTGVVADVALDAEGSVSTGPDMRVDLQSAWAWSGHRGHLSAKGVLSALAVEHEYSGLIENEALTVVSSGTLDVASLPVLAGDLEHLVSARQLTVTTKFDGEGQTWNAEVRGQYQEWPFAARFILAQGESGWWADVLGARLADAVDITGKVILQPELAADLNFEVARVDRVYADVQGDVAGRVRLQNAQITGRAAFEQLSYAEILLSDGTVDFEFSQDLTGPVRLSVDARQGAVGERVQLTQPVASATFELPIVAGAPLDGNLSGTKLVAAETEFAQPRVELSGLVKDFKYALSWQGSRLSGRVRDALEKPRITINDGSRLAVQTIELTNTDTIEIRDLGKHWSVSSHCWQGLGTLCLAATELSGTERAQVSGHVSDLPLARLNEWLPTPLEPGAQVDGAWQFRSTAGEWDGSLEVTFSGLRFTLAERPLALPDVVTRINVSRSRLDAELRAESETLSVEGSLALDGLHEEGTLTASAQFDADLAALPKFVDEIERLDGQIRGTASVQGPLQEPRFEVQGNWVQGNFAWSEPAFTLSGIEARWHADPQGWRLSGRGVPGQGGELEITGEGDGYDTAANVAAHVEGRDLKLASDLWQITVGPNIDAKVADGRVTFDGRVDVPAARVEVDTLPESLPKPSADVQVVGREPIAGAGSQTIKGNVRVVLGDDVRVKLFALDVGLVGELRARVAGDQLTSLRGELEVSDGTLSASGQTLKVESGRIMFSGDPNNPYVDLVAMRTIEDQSPPLKVGLRVVGRTDDLHTTVYSEPSMSETRALSFLVLGRDFNESSDEDSSQLVSAAIGFGLKRSQNVVQELQGALGLDELSALAAAQNDVAIVAGKRLTDDLYVRYTYNALSAVGALVIRYYLTERWRLEATDDESSSMDVMYEFTR